ncbi:DNA mismatch repair endonuclease MutL [Lujinxingia litoralis]|uniref:DNA mismatch repair endonuclease MutL n=1 Tax=Lujinxingia litoralis TaxID=2211119 RepID=UPI00131487AB|nr:DNA mismatch repair endonuclease MutL [Lujinxingia litoralis]
MKQEDPLWRNSAARHAAGEPRRVAVLPPELANQIAAGEVVERPASVVKELVENSLDAGARRIEVTIEGGGRDLIRVEDDGCGMRREDALRAIERHATSKIARVDDLFAIGTLGFRGEAVPSIASVARMELCTRPADQLEGTRIYIAGGVMQEIEDVGMAAGTSILVEELFFNTPARLKFLKTPATETRHITEMLVRVGLSRPDVRIKFVKDGKLRLDLPQVDRLKDRILEVLGREVYDDLYPTFEYPAIHGVVCRGYFSRPGHSQRSPGNMYTFVNGRYVNDRTIRAAVTGAYKHLLERGRYPSVVLFIDVPFSMVDINVHPAKTEVRFHDTQPIYRAVYHAIADALAEAPWLEGEPSRSYALGERRTLSGHLAGGDGERGSTGGVDEATMLRPGDVKIEPLNVRHRRFSEQDRLDLGELRSPFASSGGDAGQGGFSAPGLSPLIEPPRVDLGGLGRRADSGEDGPVVRDAYFSTLRVIGQFRRAYIVCEDASGLVIIDQHAAHERVGFERLKNLFKHEHKETQPLLFPLRMELDALRAETMSESQAFFAQAGFEIEHFGGTTYVLKEVPAVLQRAPHEKIIKDALDDLSNFGGSSRVEEAMESVLSRMACHSVVRGPTPLSAEECDGLLVQMDQIDFRANCPHGRPVYYRIPLMELEEAFDRR